MTDSTTDQPRERIDRAQMDGKGSKIVPTITICALILGVVTAEVVSQTVVEWSHVGTLALLACLGVLIWIANAAAPTRFFS